ncbi:MAG: HD domain-containing protein [Bdellovibrionota bacterium]
MNISMALLLISFLSCTLNVTAMECEFSPENESHKVLEAIRFAKKHHHGQFRKFDGLPYFTHPVRVAKIVKKQTQDIDLIIAAYLHDLIEDTMVNKRWIKKKFGKRVANIVNELTSDPSKIEKMGSKAEYLADKMLKMSPEALLIKLADRLDNVSDFESAELDFINKYRAETNYILTKLSKRNDLNESHKSLITQIFKKMSDGEKLYQAKVFGRKNHRNLKANIVESDFILQATKVSGLLAKRAVPVNLRSVVYMIGVSKTNEQERYQEVKRYFGEETANLVEEINSNLFLNRPLDQLSDNALLIRLAGVLENLNEILRMEAVHDYRDYIKLSRNRIKQLDKSSRALNQDQLYFANRIKIALKNTNKF